MRPIVHIQAPQPSCHLQPVDADGGVVGEPFTARGVGEICEPVFAPAVGGPATYAALRTEAEATAAAPPAPPAPRAVLKSAVDVGHCVRAALDAPPSAAGAGVLSGPVRYGFEQCLLHALARGAGVSLVDAVGAYLSAPRQETRGTSTAPAPPAPPPPPPPPAAPPPAASAAAPPVGQRVSHVGINGFATLRHSSTPTPTPTRPSPSPASAAAPRPAGTATTRTHSHSHSRTPAARPLAVVKMKVGDVDGCGHLSDAARVCAYVADALDAAGLGDGFPQGDAASAASAAGPAVGRGAGEGPPWLRLDANRSWSVAQASAFAAALTPAARRAVAYVEEPLRLPLKEPLKEPLTEPLKELLKEQSSGPALARAGDKPAEVEAAAAEEAAAAAAALEGLHKAYEQLFAGPWGALPVALDETLVDAHGWAVAAARARHAGVGGTHGAEAEAGAGAVGGFDGREGPLAVLARGAFAVVKPSLVGLAAAPLQLTAPGPGVGPGPGPGFGPGFGPGQPPVTLSCTFETGVGLAFLVCVAAWFCEGEGSGGVEGLGRPSAHGIHANAAMAAADPWTRRFQVRPCVPTYPTALPLHTRASALPHPSPSPIPRACRAWPCPRPHPRGQEPPSV